MIIPDMPIPRISVVMSVFNGMPLLADAIDSILAQTMGDFEFIIVNDGSTDGSLATLQDYATRDTRIVIIDQVNTGLTKALIRGVAAARAPLIARMDADDISMPERLEQQVKLLDLRLDFVAVSCGIENVTHDLETIGLNHKRYDEFSLPLLLAFSNIISGHGQMVFRKAAYDSAGGYDPAVRYAQDYDLWCRLLTLGPIGEADGILYRFRLGHDSISSRNSDKQRELALKTAANQYRRVSGISPKIERVNDAMDWYLPHALVTQSLMRQLKAYRHIRVALRTYFGRLNANRNSRELVQGHIAGLLLHGRDGLPPSAVFRRSIFTAMAASFAPRKALYILAAKLGFAIPNPQSRRS